MIEILINATIGFFATLLGIFFGTWLIKRNMKNPDFLIEIAENLTDYYINVKEGQEKLYGIGFVVGKGLMDGTGFAKGGKTPSLKNIIYEIGVSLAKPYLEKAIGGEKAQESLKAVWEK